MAASSFVVTSHLLHKHLPQTTVSSKHQLVVQGIWSCETFLLGWSLWCQTQATISTIKIILQQAERKYVSKSLTTAHRETL